MKSLRSLIIAALIVGPITLFGWIVVNAWNAFNVAPLQRDLAEDPGSPRSLAFAMRQVTQERPADSGIAAPTPTPTTLKEIHQAQDEELLTELSHRPPQEAAETVIQIIHKLGPDDLHELPHLLSFLRDSAPVSDELSRAFLDELTQDKLGMLPDDPTYRASVATLAFAAMLKITPDPTQARAAFREHAQALDPGWRDLLINAAPDVPQAQ